MIIHADCRYFKGDVPCAPHKLHGVHCEGCPYYDPVDKRILIIKLGAVGDVIRTTPLLRKLKEVYPRSEITWLTRTPEIIPEMVDHVLDFQWPQILTLQATPFDLLYSLDKDKEACALANSIPAKVKKGFVLRDGKCWPADDDARPKFETGVFDDVSKANTKSYLQELFEMCGFQFRGEKYVLDEVEEHDWDIPEPHPLVGLNTGCGWRWKSRLWPEENWIELARKLKTSGYGVLLLGGADEDEKNRRIAQKSGAAYVGHFPLLKFIDLMDQCDLVVTAVTMALHLAIGLEKKIVLFNNVFNRHEFELYGLGEILEPEFDCTCYYSPECPNNCMQYIYVDRVLETCRSLLG